MKINCAYDELVDVSKLVPNPKNNNKHPKEQIERLAKIIEFQGQRAPIVVSNRSGFIVKGHGRLEAIKLLGWEKCAVDYQDYESEAQEYSDMVADNQIATWAEFDTQMLLDELPSLDIDTDMLGMVEIPTLDEEEKEVVEDEVPEEVETRCKRGDIWKLGEHRLMCGDSTCVTDVEKLMNGEKADMVFTDPPYGMNLDTDYSSMKSQIFKGGIGGKKYEQGIVDDFKPEMINIILSCFNNCKEIFLWGADYFSEYLQNKNNGSWIVWDKRANGDDDLDKDLSSDKMYGSCFELCWSKNKHKREIARVKWAGIFGMYGEDKKRFHPTQKPQELCKWFLDRYSKDNQRIVDLFGGSGSTLIACEQLNRKCFMMELDEHYCDVIIQRWENLTGKKAERIENENN